MASFLRMTISEGKGKYLGLPYLIGRNKKEIFSYLREQEEGKIFITSREGDFDKLGITDYSLL